MRGPAHRHTQGGPSSLERMEDEGLVRLAVAGDHAAFETLVERYQQRVYGLARRLTGGEADAEEVLQETFVNAYRRLGGFRGDSAFSTWLYRIATNAALMLRRGRARRPTEPLDPYLPRFDSRGRHARDAEHARAADAESILDRARLARHARRALDRLPERYRIPFVLRDLEDLPTPEVASVLGLSQALVRQRVHRARLRLRGYLSHLVGVEP